jgi:hypothetical protein
MRTKRSRYVIAVEVEYPGDFACQGRFWRAVREVEAVTAEDAVAPYRGICPHGYGGGCYMATDFPPAFDVLSFRRGEKFVS